MNPSSERPDSLGYLIVKVSTARGAIPLEGASVSIQGAEAGNANIVYSLRTNRDGQTERIALPTPARAESQTPSNVAPYSHYNIDVFRDGYVPLRFQNVPVFPTIVSIQPAVMVPASAFDSDSAHRNAPAVISEFSDNAL